MKKTQTDLVLSVIRDFICSFLQNINIPENRLETISTTICQRQQKWVLSGSEMAGFTQQQTVPQVYNSCTEELLSQHY